MVSEIGLPKDELDTPALWIDLTAMENNIHAVAGTLAQAGVGWRPHTKGIKSPAIAHKLIEAGAIGITCAKLGEAEVMAAAGLTDILIANQIVGASKIRRLVHLQRQADVKVVVDNADVVRSVGEVATGAGVTVGLLIEVDCGMHRAGVEPGKPALELARIITNTAGTKFRGLMTWEGHHLNKDDEKAKQAGIKESIALVSQTAELCRDAGIPVEILSAGGSGTYKITSQLPGVTEIEAGGAIFSDLTYQKWGVDLEPALFIRSTVTSRPARDRVICDAGFKTLPRGYSTPQPTDFKIDSLVLSAEHGIIRLAQPSDTPRVGEGFDILVGYADSTVCLHDLFYGVRNGLVEAVWPISARGKLR